MTTTTDEQWSRIRSLMTEIRRLSRLLLSANESYLQREAVVTTLHRQGGKQNFSGDLITVLNNDLLLGQSSGTAQVVATLISGLSASLQAEVAYIQLLRATGRDRLQRSVRDNHAPVQSGRPVDLAGNTDTKSSPGRLAPTSSPPGHPSNVCRDDHCVGSCGRPRWDGHARGYFPERWQRIALHDAAYRREQGRPGGADPTGDGDHGSGWPEARQPISPADPGKPADERTQRTS